jgi:sugar lactone lactonase YvrE
LYAVDLTHRRIIEVAGGKIKTLIKNLDANYLTASSQGLYFSLFYKYQIGYLNFADNKTSYVLVPANATGLSLSAEQTFLNVSLADHVFGYSFAIQDAGTLAFGQGYIHYHIPYGEKRADSQGMTVDSDNLLYTSTNSGIQISDQLGRVNFILRKPAPDFTDIKLAGPGFKTLYAVSAGRLYSRKLSATGVLSWQEPVKPSKPGL